MASSLNNTFCIRCAPVCDRSGRWPVPAGVEDGLLDEAEIVVVESGQGVAEVHWDAFSDACRQAEHLSFAAGAREFT